MIFFPQLHMPNSFVHQQAHAHWLDYFECRLQILKDIHRMMYVYDTNTTLIGYDYKHKYLQQKIW